MLLISETNPDSQTPQDFVSSFPVGEKVKGSNDIANQMEHPHFSTTGAHLNHEPEPFASPQDAREQMAKWQGRVAAVGMYQQKPSQEVPAHDHDYQPFHARRPARPETQN